MFAKYIVSIQKKMTICPKHKVVALFIALYGNWHSVFLAVWHRRTELALLCFHASTNEGIGPHFICQVTTLHGTSDGSMRHKTSFFHQGNPALQ